LTLKLKFQSSNFDNLKKFLFKVATTIMNGHQHFLPGAPRLGEMKLVMAMISRQLFYLSGPMSVALNKTICLFIEKHSNISHTKERFCSQ
jgi:hypothetical protein